MTKSICFIFAAGLALAAVASAEITEEESFAEATSFVQSFMTEDAQGDSACLKVATDAIAVIQTECDGMQKTVDAAAKANQKCCKSGKAAVCAAAASQTTLSGKSADCDKQADKIQNAQITVTTHTSLAARTGGKCDAIDDSSAYKTKRAEYKKKSTECYKLQGASKESKKVLAAAVSAAAAKRTTCNNNAESALASAFKIAEGTCNSKQNQESYKRAMHMKCVLNGTPLAKCNMGKAPSVTKTNLSALNCKAITSKTTCSDSGSIGSFLGTSNWNKSIKCNGNAGITALRFQSITDMGTNRNGYKMFSIKWPVIHASGTSLSYSGWMALHSGCANHNGHAGCNAICRACGSVRADGQAFSGMTDVHDKNNNPCGSGYPKGALGFSSGMKCSYKQGGSSVTAKNKWIAYGEAKTCGNPMKTCMCRTGY